MIRFYCGVLLAAPFLFGDTCTLPAGSTLRVQLSSPSPRKWKPGAVFLGSLQQPVYRGNCRLFPTGTPVQAIAGAPSGRVEIAGRGAAATLLRIARERHAGPSGQPERTARILYVTLSEPVAVDGAVKRNTVSKGTIPAGTAVRVAIETGVHSRKSREGETVQAHLLEPLVVGGRVLVPEGAIVKGALTSARPSRRLYRAGALHFNFHALEISPGRPVSAPLAVAGAEVAGALRMDGEGGITGAALTRKRALINAGIAYATGKILDDVVEEGAKAALGATVAGSAEIAARYVGLGAGIGMFLLHRGRDVAIPAGTELVLTFSRAVPVAPGRIGSNEP